jgi:hypothetical protein
MIETTMIPEQVKVPYEQLLTGVEDNYASGARGQETAEPPAYGRDAPVGQRNFSRIPGAIKAALTGARAKYPSLRIADLMAATSPLIKYTAIKVGLTGACLDMLCFGTCKEAGCTYKHPTT